MQTPPPTPSDSNSDSPPASEAAKAATPQARGKTTVPPENGLFNIIFNILLPILILDNLSQKLGALPALVLALTFPLSYGIYDGLKRKKANFFSILGLLNVLLTGGLAVLGLSGLWFCIKEAAFPILVGLFVMGSSFTATPFIKTLFINPQLINIDLLMERLREKQNDLAFAQLMRKATLWLSLSFFFSGILNFLLAQRIFLPLEAGLDASAQSIALNHQIASMTKWSMLVILLPSMIILFTIFYRLLKELSHLSGLTTEEILHTK